jgi:hypothetical protein
MNVSLATADTELLGDPYCRRFIMSLWELAGGTIKVTPTVADDLVGNVRQSERRHWVNTLTYDAQHRNRRYDHATYRRIVNATSDAAGQWIMKELSAEEHSGITAADPTLEQAQRAIQIAPQIPRRCFRRPDHPNQRADRQIIGEAIALGYTLLATGNLNTVKREPTNTWLTDQGLIDRPLILTVEDAVKELHPGGERSASLGAVLGATLPDADRGVERDVYTITTFLNQLTATHARGCASWALDEWEALDNPAELIEQARDQLPRQSRETELRRVRTTRKAARDAGYET